MNSSLESTASPKTALVLGATGGIGGEVARQLVAAGWRVRALNRGLQPEGRDGCEWRIGDAMHRDDVLRAAAGCELIVHAVNPPGYRRWGELVLPMVDNTIAAARATGATVVLPGTVYNFGPDALPRVDEESPQHPVTRKGAIRVELERRLRAAAADGVRTIVVRAGDFFGPGAANNWFSQGLVKPGRPVRSVTRVGRAGVGHQWAYLPDVAATMLKLIERRQMLPPFAVFHMRGHWDADGAQMIEAIRRVVVEHGGAAPAVFPMPWPLLALAAPFVPLFRELREMRYLWREPLCMDNAKLRAAVGDEPHTPLHEAVRRTLSGLGCLPQAPSDRPAAGTRPARPTGLA